MNHSYILKNEERTLRPVRMEDAEFIVRLRNQPHVVGIVNDTSADIEKQRQWLREYFDRPNDYYWIIETPSGEPFGTTSLYHYDAEKKQMESGRWVQLKDERFAYNFFKSLVQINDFAFEVLGLSRIVFDVAVHNKRVIRYHQSYGAEITHVEKGLFVIQGEPVDMVWFEITRQKWVAEIRERLQRLS